MRTRHVFHAVDSHTEGMPTRVITGGVGVIPGATMAERRLHFIEHLDHLRTLLMYEPRGHASMSGAILQPAIHPDADYGVLYIEVSGLLPMCGHGTIGVATVLVETGMVPVTEPVTRVTLDTLAGLVPVDVQVEDGVAKSASLTNVPAFCLGLDRKVEVPGYGTVTYDIAFGGNFYAFVQLDDLGLPFDRDRKEELLAAGLAVMDAINASPDRPVHPEQPEIAGLKHVHLTAPGSDAHRSRHAMAIHPGWFDRSPAAPAPPPAWPSCTPAVSCRSAVTSSTSRSSVPSSPAGCSRRRWWAGSRRSCRGSRGGPDHRHRAILPRSPRPLPCRVLAVTVAAVVTGAVAGTSVHPRAPAKTT